MSVIRRKVEVNWRRFRKDRALEELVEEMISVLLCNNFNSSFLQRRLTEVPQNDTEMIQVTSEELRSAW